jgi:hypothetical protein
VSAELGDAEEELRQAATRLGRIERQGIEALEGARACEWMWPRIENWTAAWGHLWLHLGWQLALERAYDQLLGTGNGRRGARVDFRLAERKVLDLRRREDGGEPDPTL